MNTGEGTVGVRVRERGPGAGRTAAGPGTGAGPDAAVGPGAAARPGAGVDRPAPPPRTPTDEWPEDRPPPRPGEDRDQRVLVVSAVRDGQVSPLFVAHPERGAGADPFRGYVVEAADPLAGCPDVHDTLRLLHLEGGPRRGLTVAVLRRDGRSPRGLGLAQVPEGHPVLRAGELATGLDLGRVRLTLETDALPELAPRRRASAGIRLLYPHADLVLDDLLIEHTRLPGGVWQVEPLALPGEPVRPPKGARRGAPLALAVAVGEDGAACRRALDLLPGALRVHARRP
ncbi:hypothetical protein L1856_23030 [Streptomyces sp. Tue 6430]|nr:hypothetical protein [Streptomyces sp. Tue 6430]